MVWIRNHDRPGRSSYPYLTVVILFYAGVIIRSKRFIILIHKRNYIFRSVIGYRIIRTLIVKSEYRTGPIPINDPFCRRMIRYKQFGIFIILYFRITELIPIARFQFICIDRLLGLRQHTYAHIARMCYPKISISIKNNIRHSHSPTLRKRRIQRRIMSYTFCPRNLIYAFEPSSYIKGVGIIGIECHVITRIYSISCFTIFQRHFSHIDYRPVSLIQYAYFCLHVLIFGSSTGTRITYIKFMIVNNEIPRVCHIRYIGQKRFLQHNELIIPHTEMTQTAFSQSPHRHIFFV